MYFGLQVLNFEEYNFEGWPYNYKESTRGCPYAAVNNHWTGLLDMYYWTCTGLDYWITNLTTRFQLRSIKFYLKSIMASKEVSIEAVKLL